MRRGLITETSPSVSLTICPRFGFASSRTGWSSAVRVRSRRRIGPLAIGDSMPRLGSDHPRSQWRTVFSFQPEVGLEPDRNRAWEGHQRTRRVCARFGLLSRGLDPVGLDQVHSSGLGVTPWSRSWSDMEMVAGLTFSYGGRLGLLANMLTVRLTC